MTIYYFHLRDGEAIDHDDIGIELPTIEDAREAAWQGARDLIAECVKDDEDLNITRVFEICDENGDCLAQVTFRDTIRLG